MLEVERNGSRCTLHRTTTASGREILIEESDLLDCSRPTADDMGYPIHFSMREAWAAIVGYTSPEALTTRRAWHQGGSEWTSLTPRFIHPDLRPLVQRSLAQVTRDAALDLKVTNDLGAWLHALTTPPHPLVTGLFNHANTYRHAS